MISSSYKISFLNHISTILYGDDSIALIDRETQLLHEAIHFKGYGSGTFEIYYKGTDYPCSYNQPIGENYSLIRFDLPDQFHTRMDQIILDTRELADEMHNVEGLLRSVLNASTTLADVHALMPPQVQRKCPQLFTNTFQKVSLSSAEIKEFKAKHEQMLYGLKKKVLRDLLLRTR